MTKISISILRCPIILAFLFNITNSCSVSGNNFVEFPCENLELSIKMALNTDPETFTENDLLELTELMIPPFLPVTSLEGIECCTNLRVLDIHNTCIVDFSPISGLVNLEELTIRDEIPEDISFLYGLINLSSIHLEADTAFDLAQFGNIENLGKLILDKLDLEDITPLSDLHSLTALDLSFITVADYSPILELDNLICLGIHNTRSPDIDFIGTMHNLETLKLTGLKLLEVPPIENLQQLKYLDLMGNQIRHIETLKSLHNLQYLSIGANYIYDISPLLLNPGLGEGDIIELTSLPLSDESSEIVIPELELNGVSINITVYEGLFNQYSIIETYGITFNSYSLYEVIKQEIGTFIDINSDNLLEIDEIVIHGNRPVWSLEGIQYCSNLKRLEIHSELLDDYSQVCSLIHLEDLLIDAYNAENIDFVSGLANIRNLTICNGDIEDIDPLEHLVVLEYLTLRQLGITDTTPLENLQNLNVLDLSGNEITDIGPIVGNPGLGEGDKINLTRNPLSDQSLDEYIPVLEARGIEVLR